MWSIKKILILLCASLMVLSACATKQAQETSNLAPAYMLSQHATTLKQLGKEGVSVMRLGDDVVIVIPSEHLFVDYSSMISAQGETILQQIMHLLAPMNKLRINIAAYAESPTQSSKDLFLTEKEAQAVSNYFWDHHVDARFLYAVGYGGGHPIDYQPNRVINDVVGNKTNYRVEISLKDYV